MEIIESDKQNYTSATITRIGLRFIYPTTRVPHVRSCPRRKVVGSTCPAGTTADKAEKEERIMSIEGKANVDKEGAGVGVGMLRDTLSHIAT